MKYNIGDEVFVKGNIAEIEEEGSYPISVGFDKGRAEWFEEEELIPAGKTYEQGLADAWNLLKKVYDMKCETIEQIFDVEGGFWNVIRDFTYEEALAKIEAYEKEKEIKRGDEVIIEGEKILVTKVIKGEPCTTIDGIREDGDVICYSARQFEKTGKHIDIESLLRQIGE